MLVGSDHMLLFFSICIPGFRMPAHTPSPKQWRHILRPSQAHLFVRELTAFFAAFQKKHEGQSIKHQVYQINHHFTAALRRHGKRVYTNIMPTRPKSDAWCDKETRAVHGRLQQMLQGGAESMGKDKFLSLSNLYQRLKRAALRKFTWQQQLRALDEMVADPKSFFSNLSTRGRATTRISLETWEAHGK